MSEGPALAIVFSRVRLWSSNGEQYEFFMGGAPECYEDIEGHEDCVEFKEFLEKQPDADLEGITTYITTFTEGGGEPQPASKDDIDRIYTAVAETDIDAITGWNWKNSTSFQFDYDMDEQPGMHEMEKTPRC